MSDIWWMVGLVAVGSYLSRGFFLLRSRTPAVPDATPVWLEMVPSAAFAALVVPALLAPDGELELVSAELLAAVVAAAVAWRTRSIAATILLGLAAYMALGRLLG